LNSPYHAIAGMKWTESLFSDILTSLPTLGIHFDVMKGKGPVISTKTHTEEDVVSLLNTRDFDVTLPFI
jgi:uroporphyrinogen decarboxylase